MRAASSDSAFRDETGAVLIGGGFDSGGRGGTPEAGAADCSAAVDEGLGLETACSMRSGFFAVALLSAAGVAFAGGGTDLNGEDFPRIGGRDGKGEDFEIGAAPTGDDLAARGGDFAAIGDDFAAIGDDFAAIGDDLAAAFELLSTDGTAPGFGIEGEALPTRELGGGGAVLCRRIACTDGGGVGGLGKVDGRGGGALARALGGGGR